VIYRIQGPGASAPRVRYVRLRMPDRSPFAEFFVSHHVGDYLLQTDFQAMNKSGGLGDGERSRRALVNHGMTYTAAFVPALLGVARRTSVGRAVGIAALITLPHMAIDDGRLVKAYMKRVKKADGDALPDLTANVDQSMHMVCLWLAAQLARER
jgi:hypothetical protein